MGSDEAAVTTDDFGRASAVEPDGAGATAEGGRFALDVQDGWQQGRGAFGGLVFGALARAMARCEPEPARALRSLSGEIGAPVPVGRAEISVAALRRGNGVSLYEARLSVGGEVLARASGVFGRARGYERSFVQLARPAMGEPWQAVAVAPVAPPLGPAFARFYEYRPTGPLPFSGGAEARAEGWVRPRRAEAPWTAADVAALADSWWPAAFALESAPRPMVTLSYALEVLADPASLAWTEPLYYRAQAAAAADGFVAEFRELWAPDGRLVALNQQTFVVAK